MKNKKLVLASGEIFYGMGYASDVETIAEIVFNTSMVGYQEIVTDPSYYNQIVVMCYPLIGNYGVNQDDIESRRVFLSGLVIRDYNDYPSDHLVHLTRKDHLVDTLIFLGILYHKVQQ